MAKTLIALDQADDQLQTDGQFDWSKGVVNSPTPAGLEEGMCYDMLNGTCRNPGLPGPRPGSTKFRAVAVGTPQCLGYYCALDGTNQQLLAVIAGKIYKATASADWALVAGSPTLSNTTTRCNMQYYRGNLYIFSGSNSDHVWYYDGTNLNDCGSPTVSPNVPQGLLSLVIRDRMLVSDGTTIWVSNALSPAPAQFPTASPDQRIYITSANGEIITGWKALRQNQIMIGKQRSMWILNIVAGTDPTNPLGNWYSDIVGDTMGNLGWSTLLRTPHSVMWMDNGVVYEAEETAYSYVRIVPKPMSQDIQGYMLNIDFSYIPIGIFFDDYAMWQCTFLDGTSKLLVYDWRRKNWVGLWDTWNPVAFASGVISGKQTLFFCPSGGTQIYSYNVYATDDGGTNFKWMVLTRGLTWNQDVQMADSLKKTIRAYNMRIVGAYGTTTVSVIDEDLNEIVVDSFTNNTVPLVWGSLIFAWSWGNASPAKRIKPLIPRRSTAWQCRITQTGGYLKGLRSIALNGYVEPAELKGY